jgi:hypothetical protein
MSFRNDHLMTNTALLAFIATVLFASSTVLAIPHASALISSSLDNSHVTDRFYGHFKVCGTHICGPHEKTEWQKVVWDRQNISQGTITSTNQNSGVGMKMTSTTNTAPVHGSEKSMMPVINAKSVNMTGNTLSRMK